MSRIETIEIDCLLLERQMCACLGKTWKPSGMSVWTLVEEMIAEIERLRHAQN